MAILNNQSFDCVYWKRLPNDSDKGSEPVYFKATIVSDKEKSYNQRISGLITPNTRLVLRTSSPLIYSWGNGRDILGYIDFQGDRYQVQTISYDTRNTFGLGAGKFSKQHTEENAVKVITLV